MTGLANGAEWPRLELPGRIGVREGSKQSQRMPSSDVNLYFPHLIFDKTPSLA